VHTAPGSSATDVKPDSPSSRFPSAPSAHPFPPRRQPPVDPADSFFQALDSEQLLKEHGRSLVTDARELLRQDPQARVAGMITMPDSPDAPAIREFLAKMTGQAPPNGLMIGTVPRAAVEPLLRARTGTEHWLEQGWQRQLVLPVVVSTRDGHRFGFYSLAEGAAEA
jgi:hypothetical protein